MSTQEGITRSEYFPSVSFTLYLTILSFTFFLTTHTPIFFPSPQPPAGVGVRGGPFGVEETEMKEEEEDICMRRLSLMRIVPRGIGQRHP